MNAAVIWAAVVCASTGFLAQAERLIDTPYFEPLDDLPDGMEEESWWNLSLLFGSWPSAMLVCAFIWKFVSFWAIAIFFGGTWIGGMAGAFWFASGRATRTSSMRIGKTLNVLPLTNIGLAILTVVVALNTGS